MGKFMLKMGKNLFSLHVQIASSITKGGVVEDQS